MNFNRHLIWYTSEPRVPVDRDQVDLHGEDNTRWLRPTSDNTLSGSLEAYCSFVRAHYTCHTYLNKFMESVRTDPAVDYR